ncbi:hypothetical protein HYW59_02525 [Candidatus Kaiserbacteria bacterium]|nr:hypothetical protein [Candidatus Kaiserbacteria bacterium]
MEKWQAVKQDSGINKELPANLPTRKEIIENSHLSETIFDESKYRDYVKSFEDRVSLLQEQEAQLLSDFDALKPHYEKGGEIYREHVHIVRDLLSDLSRGIDNMLFQRDLFPVDKKWFLVESQVETLSLQVRDMKYAMANLYSVGTYHSVTKGASFTKHMGPGQYARKELASPYARSGLEPREMEAYFAGLLPSVENTKSETILTANGMASLTTVLALVKSEKNDGKYLIPANSYYELNKVFRHMLREPGVKDFTFQPPETLLDHTKNDDPDMIFIEPIQNDPEMREIDVIDLVSVPTKHDKRFVIVDYTISGQNIALHDIIEKSNPRNILLLISSLHKMYEQGDDVAPAGVIHVVGKTAEGLKPITEKLRALRAMLGTNITAPSLLLLQRISPDAVEEYSYAIGKNVTTLARDLQRINSPIVKKISAAAENESGASRGLVFYIHFMQDVAPRFVEGVLEKAREHKLPVMEKSAFGYRQTSLSIPGELIVRIAPGVENSRQVEILKQIFEDVLIDLSREARSNRS